jgi:hypothetical protein
LNYETRPFHLVTLFCRENASILFDPSTLISTIKLESG